MSKQRHFNPMHQHFDRKTKEAEVTDLPFDSIIDETPKAWELGFEDGTTSWFPKSQCEMYEDDNIIVVPQWLLEEKGL